MRTKQESKDDGVVVDSTLTIKLAIMYSCYKFNSDTILFLHIANCYFVKRERGHFKESI